ncbi:MAG TPA: twin-arginine translocase TatA/TatE family subunit [Opitutaceae bacterium]
MHPVAAFIEGLGGPELILIFVLCLLLFGGKRMPDLARAFGRAINEFKRAASGVESEIKRAIDEAPPAPPRRPSTPPPPPAPPKTIPAEPADKPAE